MARSRYTYGLKELAKKSNVSSQHAACIIYNGNPVAWAHNQVKGSKSYHAELSAVRQFLLQRGYVSAAKLQNILWHALYNKNNTGVIKLWQKCILWEN
jgi:hypothetical protein